MKYLAIDTSSARLTVALSIDGKNYIENDVNCGTQHSVTLMPKLEELLLSAGVELTDLDFIACVTGAGSFTGIRIGVSTAKALCYATGKPCLAVTSFDTIAYNKPSGKVLAVIDAKHGHYYVAGYNDCKLDLAPSYISHDELVELAKEYCVLSADNLTIPFIMVDTSVGLLKAVEDLSNNKTTDLSAIVPLYIRKSQAEEGR